MTRNSGEESDNMSKSGKGERVPTQITDVGPSHMIGTLEATDQAYSMLTGTDMFPSASAIDQMHQMRMVPQVMTALGPIPLPEEARKQIPEKFVAKPITEEREIYVAKKEVQERTIEVPHVHYEHKFNEFQKTFKIKKLQPRTKEIIREVPREVYKPVIEEKCIEVPQGVKYVEVPVEVECQMPPKIVPKPKLQIVERVIETIKPVVKEQIIEVPQTVVKQVPKVRTVEVPYYVPRYVEKVIEIPYRPPNMSSLPPQYMEELPMHSGSAVPKPTILGDYIFEQSLAGVPVDELNNHGAMHTADNNTYENQNHSYYYHPAAQNATLPKGYQWGPPIGTPIPDASADNIVCPGNMCAPSYNYDGTGMSGNINITGGISQAMAPMMVTCPPEFGKVSIAGSSRNPEILTTKGTVPYNHFLNKGSAELLFPPLAPHTGVVVDPSTGAPILPERSHIDQPSNRSLFARDMQRAEIAADPANCNLFCGTCDDSGKKTVYLH